LCPRSASFRPALIRAATVRAGEGWVHELKFDDYSVQAHKLGSRIVFFSRNGHDFSEHFPSIVQELRELPVKTAVIDGEVLASDADGRPNFARLPSVALGQAWASGSSPVGIRPSGIQSVR
jgi:ATP-dependent DNA ligase